MTVQVDINEGKVISSENKQRSNNKLCYITSSNNLTRETESSSRKKTQSFIETHAQKGEMRQRNISKGSITSTQFQTTSKNINFMESLKSKLSIERPKLYNNASSVLLHNHVSLYSNSLIKEVSQLSVNL